jgi:hypothetical protein
MESSVYLTCLLTWTKKPFNRPKDGTAFNGAHIDYGTVVWPGNIDIAPETLYDRSVPVDSLGCSKG